MPLTQQEEERRHRNGALDYDAPIIPVPPPGTGFAHWTHKQFEDAHLPPPGAGFRYVPSTVDLFGSEPDFADIQQGLIGDCYLLSAINALIRTKQGDFFREMIGCDAGYVQVRFFVPQGGAPAPVIVRVPRTILHAVVQGTDVPLQNHKAAWPYFIEKAYAYFRAYYLQPLGLRRLVALPNPAPLQPPAPPWPFPNVVCPPPKSGNERYARDYVEAINGGATEIAYEHLTGEKLKYVSGEVTVNGALGATTMSPGVFRCELLRAMLDEARAAALGISWNTMFDAFLKVAGRKIEDLTGPVAGGAAPASAHAALRDAVRAHVRALQGRGLVGVDISLRVIARKIDQKQEMRQADILKHLSNIPRASIDLTKLGFRPLAFADVIEEFVVRSFPGKRGTGVYADYQKALFSEIETKLKTTGAAVLPVAFAGTKQVLGTQSLAGGGRTDVDVKKKGLVPGHAYQIGGTQRIEITAAGAPRSLCFVHIRNPWHNYVRHYVAKTVQTAGGRQVVSMSGVAVDQIASLPRNSLAILEARVQGLDDEAVKLEQLASRDTRERAYFPVELSDLTKFFATISVSA